MSQPINPGLLNLDCALSCCRYTAWSLLLQTPDYTNGGHTFRMSLIPSCKFSHIFLHILISAMAILKEDASSSVSKWLIIYPIIETVLIFDKLSLVVQHMFQNNVISLGRVANLEDRLITLLAELGNTSLLSLELLISAKSFFHIMKLAFLCRAKRIWKELMENPAHWSALMALFLTKSTITFIPTWRKKK